MLSGCAGCGGSLLIVIRLHTADDGHDSEKCKGAGLKKKIPGSLDITADYSYYLNEYTNRHTGRRGEWICRDCIGQKGTK
jgi:hypothetical protein